MKKHVTKEKNPNGQKIFGKHVQPTGDNGNASRINSGATL